MIAAIGSGHIANTKSEKMIKSLRPESFSRIAPVILIAVCLIIGLLTFKDFGISWDEPSSYQYGREALSAYSHSGSEPVYSDSNGLLQYYGAAYLVTGAALVNLTGLPVYDTLHLFNFIIYLLGVTAFYFLLTRWVSSPAALATSLIFVSQPLFWGHAFINPKDIPFMTFFIVSLVLGFWMVDKIGDSTGWQRILLPAVPGLLLGYATSTRILAPLAGVMISLLALYRLRWKALPFLVIYWFACIVAVYATWPFLWPDPFNRFLASVQTMASFPWTNKILFDGISYHADNLPWRYLPKLMALQFTEPVLLLGIVGAVVFAWKIWQKKVDIILRVMLFIWFAAPLVWIVLTRPTMYDNFRQFLFIMPPVFIFCALALDELFKRWTGLKIQAVVLLLAVLPGLVAGIRLHPYEYVYYNSLAGNIAGRYETDYWATSFREAANYINQNAPQNAVVSIGPWGLIQELLRPDLQIDRSNVSPNSDYVIIFTRWNYEKNPAFTGKPVYTVERDGAVFLVIQRMP
jgi:4-amino-4-deoxy-L-arabinose transferase-like glycosyltransferase